MTEIERDEGKAEMKGSRSDYEIFKGDHITPRSLLAFDTTSETRNLKRHRDDSDTTEDLLGEDLSSFTVFVSSRAVYPMR